MHRVLRALALGGLVLSQVLRCQAALFWVSPSGTGSADGSTPANSISQSSFLSTSTHGDRGVLLDGTYSSIIFSRHSLTITSSNLWGAVVVGSPGTHGIAGNDGFHSNTISRIRVASAYVDGIKANGNRWIIEDCVVQNAGRGDPAWVTNTSGTFSGNGIAAHNTEGTIIRRCLIENNGAKLTQDHGIYANGTNLYIVSCVIRSNCGWGIQLYDASPKDNQDCLVENNLIHDNGTPGTTQSGFTLYTYGANKTNTFRQNTIIARTGKYGGIVNNANAAARFCFTNNIIQADSGYGILVATGAGTNTCLSGYNLKSTVQGGGEPQGTGDTQGTATFASAANGRYWLTSGSAGRGIALSTCAPTNDFFGRAQASVSDVGFAQYDVQLASDDNRNLGDYSRDHWIREPYSVTLSTNSTQFSLSWVEPTINHNAGWTLQRKDSVGNVFATIATLAVGTTSYFDFVSGMTNGLTYTYTLSPITQLGNQGGIHSVYVSQVVNNLGDPPPSPPAWPGITAIRPMAVSVGVNGLKTKTGVVFQ